MQVGRIAAVAGASGYAGGELLRLLLGHPGLGVGPVAAGSAAGAAGHRRCTRSCRSSPARTFAPTEPAVLAEADLVFLALPHGQSAALVAELPADLPVVDLGADFRLADAAAWPALLRRHARRQLALRAARAARRARARSPAPPGSRTPAATPPRSPSAWRRCWPPAWSSRPTSWSSPPPAPPAPAGRPRPHLLGSEVMGSLSSYKVGGVHQHTPEMEQTLSAAAGTGVTLSFTPMLAPMPRGILATCTARLAAGDDRGRRCARPCTRRTTTSRSCTCCRRARWPTTAATLGSNSVHLQVAADRHSGRAVVVAAPSTTWSRAPPARRSRTPTSCSACDETAGLPVNGVAP